MRTRTLVSRPPEYARTIFCRVMTAPFRKGCAACAKACERARRERAWRRWCRLPPASRGIREGGRHRWPRRRRARRRAGSAAPRGSRSPRTRRSGRPARGAVRSRRAAPAAARRWSLRGGSLAPRRVAAGRATGWPASPGILRGRGRGRGLPACRSARPRAAGGRPGDESSCSGRFAASSSGNERPDAFVGEQLSDDAVWDASVEEVRARDAVLQRLEDRARLHRHAAGNGAVLDVRGEILRLHLLDQLSALEDAGDVGEIDELARADGDGDLGRDLVGVDVVALPVLADADGRDDRHVALRKQHLEEVLVDPRDLPHLAQVPALVLELAGAKESAVLAGHAQRLTAIL